MHTGAKNYRAINVERVKDGEGGGEGQILEKITLEIKRINFGNQKIVSEIKQKTKESKQIIILVVLLEHRSSLHLTTTARTISIAALEYADSN